MSSRRNISPRHQSLSSYEIMFAALFAILVVVCAGIIAVSWLAVNQSERGKSCTWLLKVFFYE
jgi:serine protease 7 (enterokinase)